MKKLFLLLIFIPVFVFAEAMYSPTWGFFLDLPAGYEFVDGDGRDRFSFSGPAGMMFDLIVYDGRYNSMQELVEDVSRRLSNRGDVDFFLYNGRQAAIIELIFGDNEGWGFVVELGSPGGHRSGSPPMLLALAYSPADIEGLDIFHISALDSIAPTLAERRYPGPLMEYGFPRGERRNTPLAISGLSAMIHENDAEAAQVLIEREFAIYLAYINTPYVQQAAIRYYRFIYRDSFDRIADAASVIVNHFGGFLAFSEEQQREFAQRILTFVQGFHYERDLSGSDFINLVTAITEGRGDCDPRSMLFAMLLANANIRSALMLSYHYSHAMGLADIAGSGARFESHGIQWLVAETTANVDIGLIAADQSDSEHWFAVLFE